MWGQTKECRVGHLHAHGSTGAWAVDTLSSPWHFHLANAFPPVHLPRLLQKISSGVLQREPGSSMLAEAGMVFTTPVSLQEPCHLPV